MALIQTYGSVLHVNHMKLNSDLDPKSEAFHCSDCLGKHTPDMSLFDIIPPLVCPLGMTNTLLLFFDKSCVLVSTERPVNPRQSHSGAGYQTAHLKIARFSLSTAPQEMRLNGTIYTIWEPLLFLLMALTASILWREAVQFLEMVINSTEVSTRIPIYLFFIVLYCFQKLKAAI